MPDITIRMLGPDHASVLDEVAPGVFDNLIDARWTSEFFADARHHLAVALDDTTVVGMASAVHYVHPDKPPELWVNEVGVAPTHQGQHIGRRLLQTLFARGRELGCCEAWLGTDVSNAAARRLYAGLGGTEEPFVLVSFRLDDPRGAAATLQVSAKEDRMRDRDEDIPIDDAVEGPKVIHLHNRDFAGTSFAANETEQMHDKRDPLAEPDVDDRRNSLSNVQDQGLTP